MNGVSSKLREFTERLLAHEASVGKHGAKNKADAFRVCEKLRGPLSRLTGVGGFRSILSRALTLASAEVPMLRALQIGENGSLEGVEKLGEKLGSRELGEGAVALVSHLLSLLVTFIGPALTLWLLRDTWPTLKNMSF